MQNAVKYWNVFTDVALSLFSAVNLGYCLTGRFLPETQVNFISGYLRVKIQNTKLTVWMHHEQNTSGGEKVEKKSQLTNYDSCLCWSLMKFSLILVLCGSPESHTLTPMVDKRWRATVSKPWLWRGASRDTHGTRHRGPYPAIGNMWPDIWCFQPGR